MGEGDDDKLCVGLSELETRDVTRGAARRSTLSLTFSRPSLYVELHHTPSFIANSDPSDSRPSIYYLHLDGA